MDTGQVVLVGAASRVPLPQGGQRSVDERRQGRPDVRHARDAQHRGDGGDRQRTVEVPVGGREGPEPRQRLRWGDPGDRGLESFDDPRKPDMGRGVRGDQPGIAFEVSEVAQDDEDLRLVHGI
jgi:hypothetical protein